MAMKLAIDPDLIAQALELSGDRTESAVVTRALQEFNARRQQRRLLYLIGRFEWDRSYDYRLGAHVTGPVDRHQLRGFNQPWRRSA